MNDKILVVGAGASGLFCGGILSQKGYDVTIIDGNEKCGKKIYITGKGRCNLTNNCSAQEYLNNVVHGEKFMMSAINGFNSQDTIAFFENLGMKTKTERGGRVFPESDKASDVTKYLVKNAEKCKFILNEKVNDISVSAEGFKVTTDHGHYLFDKVIVATGGKSYPATGSKGDGYKFAKKLGLSVVNPRSALAPIKIKDKFCSNLEGLSLKNVMLNCQISGRNKQLFGEMLFTNDAISGPIALSMSSYVADAKDVKISIDFKPALTVEQLEKRLLNDFKENLNKNITYIIKGLLPNRLVDVFLKRINLSGETKVNSVTISQRQAIIRCLKNFELTFDSIYPVESGIVTGGGIELKEINPKTMECKKIKNLYFIGEVLDVDCLTGGFNLQTAFSTAYACANNM